MKPQVLIMNFTNVHKHEKSLQNCEFKWIDCTQLSGTSRYCDKEAEKQLIKKISPFAPDGIHFIDSGNYHYMSKLWTDKIKRPFYLIVFDHHPDLQPPLFDNLLSCGCWIKHLIDTNHYLKKVFIMGVSEEYVDNIEFKYKDQLVVYSNKDLNRKATLLQIAELKLDEPVYISIDKDVLDTNCSATNWNQGSLSLTKLKEILSTLAEINNVIGVDICGECSTNLDLYNLRKCTAINDFANKVLIDTLSSHMR